MDFDVIHVRKRQSTISLRYSNLFFHSVNPNHVYVCRRTLRCLNELLGRQVWVFSSEPCPENAEALYLSTEIETFVDIWGPAWRCCNPENLAEIYEYRVGNGVIVPWAPNESEKATFETGIMEIFCHWASSQTTSTFIEMN